MKIGDKVKVTNAVYESLPVGTLGTLYLIEDGWDDSGNEAKIYYIDSPEDRNSRNPLLYNELETVE